MKRTLIISLVAVFSLISGCTSQQASKDKWQNLFDGKTLDGWVQRGGNAKYTVENGVIIGETVLRTPNSFLCTEKNYSDFILELEFQVDEKLNSGIQIRSESKPDYKDGRVHGYQIEIDPSTKPYSGNPRNLLADGTTVPLSDPRSWTGGIYGEGKRGWLNNLTKNQPARSAFKRGQWNHFHIEATGDTIKTWLNGVPAADFKDKPDELVKTGFIALQVHGAKTAGMKVKWRNIRIYLPD